MFSWIPNQVKTIWSYWVYTMAFIYLVYCINFVLEDIKAAKSVPPFIEMPKNCTKNNWNIPFHPDEGQLYVTHCSIVNFDNCIDFSGEI